MTSIYDIGTDTLRSPVQLLEGDRALAGPLKPFTSIRLHGPRCYGCEKHKKALMLTLMTDGKPVPEFLDCFMDKFQADVFFSVLDELRQKASAPSSPTRIALDLHFTGKITLELNAAMLAQLFKDAEKERAPVGAFKDPVFTGEPRRMTEDEREKEVAQAAALLDKHYKQDVADIDVSDVDAGTLLAALYNNALTGGAGTQNFSEQPMSRAEGLHILSEIKRIGALPEIDYINGRSIKTYFEERKSGLHLRFTRYWDYNHMPFSFVLAAAKAGFTHRLHGHGILDIDAELSALFAVSASSPDHDKVRAAIEKAVREMPIEEQRAHIEKRQDATRIRAHTYQLSIAGNGKVRDEVGHLIRPFAPRIFDASTPSSGLH